MMMHTTLLLKKLNRFVQLGIAEEKAIAALPFETVYLKANRTITREGDSVFRFSLIVDGYACRHKITGKGRRQILSVHIPGDIIDLPNIFDDLSDYNVQTITPLTVAFIQRKALCKLASDYPLIGKALIKDSLVDAAILRERLVSISSRDAKARVAHFICEFVTRRADADIFGIGTLELPFTQKQIGDATGLTSVHVNRMLRVLTGSGAFAHVGREYAISDWPLLKRIAGFNPAYLHNLTHLSTDGVVDQRFADALSF